MRCHYSIPLLPTLPHFWQLHNTIVKLDPVTKPSLFLPLPSFTPCFPDLSTNKFPFKPLKYFHYDIAFGRGSILFGAQWCTCSECVSHCAAVHLSLEARGILMALLLGPQVQVILEYFCSSKRIWIFFSIKCSGNLLLQFNCLKCCRKLSLIIEFEFNDPTQFKCEIRNFFRAVILEI